MVNQPDAISLIETGLRAAGTRQKVIANNIANAETPSFRRSQVQFEDVMARALRDGQADLTQVQAKVLTTDEGLADGALNNVDLDSEVGDMVKNDATYKTCMRMLTKMYRQMDLAIQTG